MLSSLQRSACAACRLRQNIAAKQLARTKWPLSLLGNQQAAARRGFTAGAVAAQRNRRVAPSKKRAESQEVNNSKKPEEDEEDGDLQGLEGDLEAMDISEEQERLSRLLFLASLKVGMDTERMVDLVAELQKEGSSVEERALRVREAFGDLLPEGLLGEEEERVYLMLYGEPVRRFREEDLEAIEEEVVSELEGEVEGEHEVEGTGVERMGRQGVFEKVEFVDEGALIEEDGEGDESLDPATANARLYEDMRQSMGREEELDENDDEDNDPSNRSSLDSRSGPVPEQPDGDAHGGAGARARGHGRRGLRCGARGFGGLRRRGADGSGIPARHASAPRRLTRGGLREMASGRVNFRRQSRLARETPAAVGRDCSGERPDRPETQKPAWSAGSRVTKWRGRRDSNPRPPA